MTDESPVDSGKNLDKGRFKKGYDPRRWMTGRPRIPKDKAAANKLIEHLIWDVLSETIVNPSNGQEIDRLRAMIRSMTTNKNMQDKILDRILGKVQQPLDLTSSDGTLKPIVNIYIPSNNRNDTDKSG